MLLQAAWIKEGAAQAFSKPVDNIEGPKPWPRAQYFMLTLLSFALV